MTLAPEFCSMMNELLGSDEAQQLLDALEQPAPSSIRLSRYKPYTPPSELIDTSVPWCDHGYYLSQRPTFTGQSPFHAGAYYVQEASSMLIAAIEPLLGNEPLCALDLCAAPGGKSTLLLDILPKGSILLSNEVVKHRANILVENLQKWGNPHSIVSNAMPALLGRLHEAFDLILVDAPCSGEGMFRKDLAARQEWNAGSPTMCAERQKDILRDIWTALRPGGLMVYSTCTMNREENEEVLTYIIETLGAKPIDIGELGHGVWCSPFTSYPCYRMMPHRTRGEGLFMAIMRKSEELELRPPRPKTKDKTKAKERNLIPQEAYGYLTKPEDFVWELRGEDIQAYPEPIIPLLHSLQELRVPILSAGIPVATRKGKDLIPHTALALSTALEASAFEWVELEDRQVIPYLSREAIQLPESLSTGIKLVHHRGLPLGFVKHLGRRCNNLYPQEWRIRHGEKLHQEQL